MRVFLCAATALFGCSLSALAIPTTTISVEGDGELGDFAGTMAYTGFSSLVGRLVFELTNTSPPENGGYLTAFVFNVPDSASLDQFVFHSEVSSAQFNAIEDNGSGNSPTKAEPYGTFDLGASSTGQFLGGGNPTSGLPTGGSGTFTFWLAGSGLDLLTVHDFIAAGTSLSGFDGEDFFVTRFRGFEDGGSNKTTGSPSDPGDGGGPSPVPDGGATFSLLGLGLLSLLLGARRKGKAA